METTNKAMAEQTANPTPTPTQQAVNPSPTQQVLKPEVITKLMNPVSLQQLIKRDRGMMTLSDDNMMLKQIHETHAPDGREFNVRPLFRLVEDILNRATLTVDPLTSVKHCFNLLFSEDITFFASFFCSG